MEPLRPVATAALVFAAEVRLFKLYNAPQGREQKKKLYTCANN